jgi:putative FmdB family regulatory protein
VPIYEFACEACGERFEELTRPGDGARCPACGGAGARVYSQVATLKLGLRGGEAKRSEATRRDARERKRESMAKDEGRN